MALKTKRKIIWGKQVIITTKHHMFDIQNKINYTQKYVTGKFVHINYPALKIFSN